MSTGKDKRPAFHLTSRTSRKIQPMAKTMHITVATEFTGDEFEQATQLVALKPIYDQLKASLEAAGVKATSSMKSVVARAARGSKTPYTGKPRGRKPNVAPVPAPATSEDLEAA